jgi:actin-like ATPase involved in cell morphogenesis
MYKPLGIDLGASKVAITSADGHPPVVELPPKLPADPVSVSVGGAISDLAVTAEGGEEALASAFRDGIAGPLTGITIASAISRFLGEDALGNADVLLSIPCSFGEMEEVALAEMAVAAGARDAYLVYAPLAAYRCEQATGDISPIERKQTCHNT